MNPVCHISSLVVHLRPQKETAVHAALAQIDGVEVHAIQDGKAVITLETESEAGIVERINRINGIDGILSAVLIHHHSEDAASLEEEIDENHASGVR
ncbi:MAG: chaperone NapD [Gammaproteobacteria bacterium]|nr:chaperone NapD [Gammaproteobacteria bacterium]